jgi:hypothetical protein
MNESPIAFEFSDRRSALYALDTLEELGYQPHLHEQENGYIVHFHVERNDLTSALEIAQAHGGSLMELDHQSEQAAYDTAYNMDAIRIPAHIVNEDWADDYTSPEAHITIDPSPESYDHFSGDVHA